MENSTCFKDGVRQDISVGDSVIHVHRRGSSINTDWAKIKNLYEKPATFGGVRQYATILKEWADRESNVMTSYLIKTYNGN